MSERWEWIDVKKQLPEEEKNMFVSWAMPDKYRSSSYVLVTIKDNDCTQGLRKFVTVARYDYAAKRWVVRSSHGGEVLAWTPLPSPANFEAKKEDEP